MINTLYIVTASGDVMVEKHYRSVLSRGVLDPFFAAHTKAMSPEEVEPAQTSGKFTLINIYRENIFIVAVVSSDVSPLFIFEFLHRCIDVFLEYFGKTLGESVIRKYTVTVYQLLEEMLDNGYPLATEPNILREMIRPPTWTAVFDSVTGSKNVKEKLPSGVSTNTQWRRAGVKYSSNEAFVDVHENVDCITDRNGSIIFNEIRGEVNMRTKLSGMPECQLTFINPRLLDDVSFHPCVRLADWTNRHTLSFIPPDGNFNLAKYILGPENQITVPIQIRPSIVFNDTGGKLDIEISPRSAGAKPIEDVVITISLPKQVNSVSCNPTVGTQSFDSVDRIVRWDVKKLPIDRPSQLRGTISIQPGAMKVEHQPTVRAQFKISGFVSSGVKVSRLEITGEKYKPFKGVKYTTTAGRYEVRS
eukprot:m.433235 g.433235  ORF g.433235 m.433235 type:complete len:417 (-) comp17547_c0_seq1:141-1391(-)